jgi:hypothetical protein
MGVTGNKKYSETLLKSFRPVKIFWDNPKNNGGIFHGFLVILKSLFNVVFRRKTKS